MLVCLFFANKVEIDLHHQMFIIIIIIIITFLIFVIVFFTSSWHCRHILGPGLFMLKSKFWTQITLRSNNVYRPLRIIDILLFGWHILWCVFSTYWDGTFGIFNETTLHNIGNCVHILRKDILQFGWHILCCVFSTYWDGTFGIFNETTLHNMRNCVHILRKDFAQSWLEKRMLMPLLTNINYSSSWPSSTFKSSNFFPQFVTLMHALIYRRCHRVQNLI